MKHIDVINTLNKNAQLIDKAYKEEGIDEISSELLESTIFIKIHDRYKLNKNYINFVDSVLLRIDYTIIFGNYEKEYKELVKAKNRYMDTKNSFYIQTMQKLVENLYEKFQTRDREIQILLMHLQNDTSLDIDILIENATDTLDKIYELIDANEKVGVFFRNDIRGLDSSIDALVQNISVDMLKYIHNIDDYIDQVNRFIVQTKNRRIQNKQLLQLSSIIMSEKTMLLDEHLLLSSKKSYFTFMPSQKNRIFVFPQENDIKKMKKWLKNNLASIDTKSEIKECVIKPQAKEKLEIIDVEKIIQDLELLKSEDIFIFIKEHSELKKYSEKTLLNEAFKTFLYLTSSLHVEFKDEFNDFGIKVARWV